MQFYIILCRCLKLIGREELEIHTANINKNKYLEKTDIQGKLIIQYEISKDGNLSHSIFYRYKI